jgi:putative drug exporter of the RND superfamily
LPELEHSGQSAIPRSWFARLGQFIYRYRHLVILAWVALVSFSLALTPQLDRVLQGTGMLYNAGEAQRAEQRLKQELNIDPDALTIVFQTQNPVSAADSLTIQPILDDISKLSAVRSLTSAAQRPEYRSQDGRTQYAIVSLQAQGNAAVPVLDQIEQVLNHRQAARLTSRPTDNLTDDLKVFLIGKPVVDREVQQISKIDLGRAELTALPLTLVALLIVFRSIVAASMPVAMGAMTVSVTFGLLYLVSLKLSVSIFALNIASMLGLGLGIDYSLIIVNRFREELVAGSVQQAVIRAIDTAGRAVFFSGLTVCIGLVALLLFPILLLQSLGVAGSLVVLISVAAALTLLPALLSVIGHRINWGINWHWIDWYRSNWHRVNWQRSWKNQLQTAWLRVFQIQPIQAEGTENSSVWETIARLVIQNSLVAIAIVLIIISGLTAPFLGIRFGLGGIDILPQTTAAHEGVTLLEDAFGLGEASPILLEIHSKTNEPILSKSYIETLYYVVQQLEADSRVATVQSLFNLVPHLNAQSYQQLYADPAAVPAPLATAIGQLSSRSTTLIAVTSRTRSNDPDSQSLVADLRALSLQDLEVQVAGQTASALDTIDIVYRRFPIVLCVIMTVTFLALCALLNSVVLPLKAIAMNLLSIGASFGALVFIFQQGNFQSWLNFTAVGYLDVLLPIVLFCVLFGLSMDYEVFLLSRIKEAYDQSGDNSESVIEGLKQTGGMITSAALLMIIVTSAFAFTSIIFVKALGLGTAIAVLVDATLIRAILVPATMHLMGKWNWWMPEFLNLDRIRYQIRLK